MLSIINFIVSFLCKNVKTTFYFLWCLPLSCIIFLGTLGVCVLMNFSLIGKTSIDINLVISIIPISIITSMIIIIIFELYICCIKKYFKKDHSDKCYEFIDNVYKFVFVLGVLIQFRQAPIAVVDGTSLHNAVANVNGDIQTKIACVAIFSLAIGFEQCYLKIWFKTTRKIDCDLIKIHFNTIKRKKFKRNINRDIEDIIQSNNPNNINNSSTIQKLKNLFLVLYSKDLDLYKEFKKDNWSNAVTEFLNDNEIKKCKHILENNNTISSHRINNVIDKIKLIPQVLEK